MERGVRDGNPVCTRERCSTIASMTGRSRFAGFRLVCGHRIPRQDRTGFLRTPFPQQPLCHGMEGDFEFLALGFAQRRTRAAIDNLV